MKLSLDVIVEALSPWRASVRSNDTAVQFESARICTKGTVIGHAGRLYFCEPELIETLDRDALSTSWIVTVECSQAAGLPNVVTLCRDCPLGRAADVIFELFDRTEAFSSVMKDCIISDKGLQPFFDVARPYFPDCLLVMSDSAYNLVARTADAVESNEYLSSILQRGFYNKEDLDLMAAAGYFQDELKYKVPVLYPASCTISRVPFLVRSFRRSGASAFFIGCYFLHGNASLFIQRCFQAFTDAVGGYMFSHMQAEDMLPIMQKMIEDLIHSEHRDYDFIYDRCSRLHIPFQGSFRLGLIRGENINDIKAAQMVNQLNVYCSVKNYGVFQHNASVIILFNDWHRMGVKESAVFEDNWRALMRTLDSNQVHIGISLSFESIDRFCYAYKQASQALLQGTIFGNPGETAFFYSRYFLHDMLSAYDSILPLETTYTPYLDLLNEGKNISMGNLYLLYVYLASERNVALTARRVHMHRNGVLYRIDKIRDMIGLDLESSEVRLRLLLSFKILEHTGKIKLGDFQDDEEELTGGTALIE